MVEVKTQCNGMAPSTRLHERSSRPDVEVLQQDAELPQSVRGQRLCRSGPGEGCRPAMQDVIVENRDRVLVDVIHRVQDDGLTMATRDREAKLPSARRQHGRDRYLMADQQVNGEIG